MMTTSPSETTVEDVKPKRIRKPRQVRITATEAEVAKRLNVPLEKLAEQKMKASRVKRKAFKRTPKEQALFDQLLNDNMAFIAQNNNHIKEILELKHQINGFRAVISYLEHHVGLRTSQ